MGWLYRNWTYPSSALATAALTVLVVAMESGDVSRGRMLAWALVPVYACHQVEEHAWPGGFKRFVNAHAFGITDRDFPLTDAAVFWINVPLTWVLFPLAALLVGEAPWLSAGCFTIGIINGMLHGVFGIRFRGWNPGLVTGLTLLIPVGIVGYRHLDGVLSTAESIAAWAIGIATHLALVGFALVRLRGAPAPSVS
jgi:hypothetical protein